MEKGKKMAEYIERETAIDVIMSEPTDAHYPSWYADKIESISVADVAPVRYGRWVDKPNPQWKAYDIRYCSVCGWSIHKTKLRNSDLSWRFCPNCGAKMDGERKTNAAD